MSSGLLTARLSFLALIGILLGFTLLPVRSIAQDTGAGELILRVVIIEDLKLNPVPLASFRITRTADTAVTNTLRTDELGILKTELPAGDYLLESAAPITFRGNIYRWSRTVTIARGARLELTLTNEDAETTATAATTQPTATEGELYSKYLGGVVTVESGTGGHGTGFLVDKRGLILTNQHVTDGSHWLAVRFGPGKRYAAVIVEEDAPADVAVIMIAPDANPDAVSLNLGNPKAGTPVNVGERILAIGSPLDQEQLLTTGIISRVTEDALMSDININPGNSGGPILNLKGEVIGLATFGTSAGTGPGISGIVPITKALPVLERARAKMDAVARPEARALPDISPVKMPVALMDKAAKSDLTPIIIKEKLADFAVTMETPQIHISLRFAEDRKLERARKKRLKDKSPDLNLEKLKTWQNFDAVVALYVTPQLKETAGSFIGSVISVAALGVDVIPDKYQYRDDFKDMQLYRGGEPVEPVRRDRVRRGVNVENPYINAVDYAYCGMYQYDPMVFEPDKPLVLKINTGKLEKKNAPWETITINPKVQQQIWESFAAWRDEVAKAAQPPVPDAAALASP